ncbi:uncharacterized protein F5891DRAFT_1130850 [Suillus fuscotomentosus]|uniref:DUF3752 domain-containing protein n=1 Tax=Suillus fuscotomentosus TaxID=1912939 RepID=A0AAD4DXM9_9AGAM|nr:uncharacterized protein F5891DRAFT_1130850 [Suillus fuscotomentosus]KAG1894754.1 hypothetical protein F5891DRAFT_1130850 [Suillus fuscotomentosus]
MSSIGPQIPAHLLATVASAGDSDEDDDYTPALPPDLSASRAAGPSLPSKSVSNTPLPQRHYVGPSVPHSQTPYDDDSDSDVGPQPLPAAYASQIEEKSGVEEFMEREERRRKLQEEASKPKKLQREEWMLVPPKSGDLLASLDPTKARPRQFARSAAPSRDNSGSSLWTETPAERQQRLADEVAGRKRRAANAPPEEDSHDTAKRRRRDEEIRRGVDEHTRKARGSALVESHLEREKEEEKHIQSEPSVIWDHERDMSLGGRLMDDKQRQKMLRDAKGLGERFGSGRNGSFL